MTKAAYRYYVLTPDQATIVGYDTPQAALSVAQQYGEGSHIVDTAAMAYQPMVQKIERGEAIYLEYGGWDTRVSVNQNLIEAVKKGYAPIVRAFLAKGAVANAAIANGGTALIWAVARGRAELVRLLLSAGADPDAADADGTTPLKLAERRGKHEIVAILRAAGARS